MAQKQVLIRSLSAFIVCLLLTSMFSISSLASNESEFYGKIDSVAYLGMFLTEDGFKSETYYNSEHLPSGNVLSPIDNSKFNHNYGKGYFEAVFDFRFSDYIVSLINQAESVSFTLDPYSDLQNSSHFVIDTLTANAFTNLKGRCVLTSWLKYDDNGGEVYNNNRPASFDYAFPSADIDLVNNSYVVFKPTSSVVPLSDKKLSGEFRLKYFANFDKLSSSVSGVCFWGSRLKITMKLTMPESSAVSDYQITIGNNVADINNNLGAIASNQATIINQNNNIFNSIVEGFSSIPEKVKTGVTNALNDAFVPDANVITGYVEQVEAMEEEHIPPVSQVKTILQSTKDNLLTRSSVGWSEENTRGSTGFVSSDAFGSSTAVDVVNKSSSTYIYFPSFSVPLPGGNYKLWDEHYIDLYAILNDSGLGWIATLSRAIASIFLVWRFVIWLLHYLGVQLDNLSLVYLSDLIATFGRSGGDD